MTDSLNSSQEQFAGSNRINDLIHICFHYVCDQDKRRFIAQFRNLPQDSDHFMHTLRELVLGAYLAATGIQARYHCLIEGRTPDWCVCDEKGRSIAFVEVVNFHIDRATESAIEGQLRTKRIASVWRDANKDNVTRLYHSLCQKAQESTELAISQGLPCAIALFGDFRAALDFTDDVAPCLFDKDTGLFMKFPNVGGLLYFEEASGRYIFTYAPNPFAVKSLSLRSGAFPDWAA